MTAESRGKILGERPLERSSNDTSSASTSADIQLQFHLSDTFTKPASFNELPDVAKPFQDDPAKQGRFEQFLKEKHHGGLRSKDSSGSSYMSEAARARERLEFEAAAEAITTGKCGKDTGLSNHQLMEDCATKVDLVLGDYLEFVKNSRIVRLRLTLYWEIIWNLLRVREFINLISSESNEVCRKEEENNCTRACTQGFRGPPIKWAEMTEEEVLTEQQRMYEEAWARMNGGATIPKQPDPEATIPKQSEPQQPSFCLEI
ncbi:G patch domain-containing protein TGH-like isoform X2 [Actinidia eriantha]|uniref:G patch domain-containing protein TGH-like isoform X2 n=1 Tax=Actinidia eriantha TaxID=165200 RepID=UPI00258EC2C0|nr:G patch domain-containing protein TGH-like isoform X2 [Actinidia eriantha]